MCVCVCVGVCRCVWLWVCMHKCVCVCVCGPGSNVRVTACSDSMCVNHVLTLRHVLTESACVCISQVVTCHGMC